MVICGLCLQLKKTPSWLCQSNDMILSMQLNMNETFSYLLPNPRTGLITKETLSGKVNFKVLVIAEISGAVSCHLSLTISYSFAHVLDAGIPLQLVRHHHILYNFQRRCRSCCLCLSSLLPLHQQPQHASSASAASAASARLSSLSTSHQPQ